VPTFGPASLNRLAALAVSVVATACSQTAKGSSNHLAPVSTIVRHPLPPVVEGVPLLALANEAVGAARAYSVKVPQDVQAVVSTQTALYRLIPEAGVSTSPEYDVSQRGRFYCPSGCGISPGGAGEVVTSTTAPHTVPIETMVLEIPVGSGTAPNGMFLGVLTPDLSKLGRVYNLDPYVRSLANVNVREGPFPS